MKEKDNKQRVENPDCGAVSVLVPVSFVIHDHL